MHGVNQDHAFVELPFTATDNAVEKRAPDSGDDI